MSNVAIKGGATGTATYTIEAPTGNTDRTLVLPDEAGTILTTNSFTFTQGGEVTEYESGGTIYRVPTFLNSGTQTFPTTSQLTVDFLIVGGGGGSAIS